jgi:proteic killer suppression protein
MIRSFRDKDLKRFVETGETGKLPVPNTKRLRRVLMALQAAETPSDMDLPGFGFHSLRGARKGTYAVRVTGNWRLTFRWEKCAVDVAVEDYH